MEVITVHLPVSYTHLDVYKRQKVFRYSDETAEAVASGEKLLKESGTISVSYTHLDVYKRQILSG